MRDSHDSSARARARPSTVRLVDGADPDPDAASRIASNATAVAHELRHALAVPIMALRAAGAGGPVTSVSERQSQFLSEALAELENLSAVVESLLAVAGPAGPEVRPCEVDLVSLVRQVAEHPTWSAAHTVDVHAGEGCRVLADPPLVKRVVANLLANATRCSPAGTTVTIDVAGGGPFVSVAVSDEGCGIDPRDREAIFAPGVRTGERRGFGLGLWIVREIVTAHGGRTWAEPGAKCGLKVCFTLRAAEPSPLQIGPAVPLDDAHRSGPHVKAPVHATK